MSTSRKRRRSQLKSIDEINMTPLIDLTFLLLIVFMITMPVMEYSSDVNPPALNSTPLPDENARYVSVKPGGIYVLDKMEYNEDQYRTLMQQMFASTPNAKILVRADATCTVEEFISAVRAARHAGFEQVQMVHKAEQ